MEREWRKRLRFVIDMVFVSAMTILILNFNIPEQVNAKDPMEFVNILLNQANHFEIFIISFLTIGVYWVKNLEYYAMLKALDKTLIWAFLFYLIGVMFLPIANVLFGLFPDGVGIRIMFSLLMILMGVLSFFVLKHAQRNQLIYKAYKASYVDHFAKQLLMEPLIALIGILLAFIHPDLWDLSFVLIPIGIVFAKKYKDKIKDIYLKGSEKLKKME